MLSAKETHWSGQQSLCCPHYIYKYIYIYIHIICIYVYIWYVPIQMVNLHPLRENKPISREIHKNNLENTLGKTHNKHE